MQYSKPMIDIILELRRRVPSNLKPGIKLANPDVLNELIAHYPASSDNVSRALIKELLMMAGDDWLIRLEKPVQSEGPKPQVKVYRGQVRLEEAKPAPNPTAQSPKKTRVYRGQVINY
ncbi:hypothetical protein QWI17_12995 [Gilvimarinus sp. SDUM040013]|uniref:Uncharacterized protein n=1 Tax=Gilvimarinus gilvus TaxID=3058038 RepID=A0ABU4RUH3_9GAMM|nr:hypothetical protein [Gilvimarinus sp. SDUM040013]MDO3386756.1 hypothetical protein [Gilvimarinus sp. SDUM040013]MDX6848314.1 hypothetical protein [Gilvimarinus sp. SDUM040013]